MQLSLQSSSVERYPGGHLALQKPSISRHSEVVSLQGGFPEKEEEVFHFKMVTDNCRDGLGLKVIL